ncbi:MAG: hypothetical protein K8T25_21065 [Planctomycetia bacterium]|nr:hypothetical protein [Planctomycetia bacterium]
MCAYDTTLLQVMTPPRTAALSASTSPNADAVASRSQRRGARLELLLPRTSRGTLAVVAALAGIFLATSFYRLNDTDLWGHLAYGRWIAEHHRLPSSDPMGVADAGRKLIDSSWLAQWGGYLWYQVAGPGGVQLVHAALITLAIGILIWAVRLRGVPIGIAVASGVAAYMLALPIVGTVRPQLFGLLGMSLVLLALSLVRKSRSPWIWLPIVFALWANLHGSFLIGLVVIGCAATGRLIDVAWRCGNLKRAWAEPVGKRMRLLAMFCLAATLLNPAGPALWWHVLMFGNERILADISEWQPTTLHSLTGTLLLVSVMMTGVLVRASRRPIRMHEVLLVLILGLATLSAIRMLCWWALVWPYLAAPHAAAVWQAWRRRRSVSLDENRMSHAAEPTAMRTLIAMAVVFMVLVWSPPTHELIAGRVRSEAIVCSTDTPLFVADEIRARGLQGRVFAPLEWADYLLWHTHNAVQPLVYSHVHLFTTDTWHDYRTIAGAAQGFVEAIDRQGIGYLIVPRRLAALMAHELTPEGRFRTLYQDQQAMLLEVRGKPARK